MPGPWLSWTRTLSCKSDSREIVYDPRQKSSSSSSSSKIQPAPVVNPISLPPQELQQIHDHPSNSSSSSGGGVKNRFHKALIKSSCSNCSLANLRDVVHGNTRVVHRASSSSGSPAPSNKDFVSDFLHEVSQDALFLLDDSSSSPADPNPEAPLISNNSIKSNLSASQQQQQHHHHHHHRKRFAASCNGCSSVLETMDSMVPVSLGSSRDSSSAASMLARNSNCSFIPQISCQKCGDCFSRVDALEQHHTLQHAVSELGRGDSSRNIIEIIFRSSWLSTNGATIARIERVLKVHNSQRTIARFEDYRDGIKFRANCITSSSSSGSNGGSSSSNSSKMMNKHARCIADGNELLRFYGSSVVCPLGAHGSNSICSQPHCSICRIIRCGFSAKNRGICTTATSSRAHAQSEEIHGGYTNHGNGNGNGNGHGNGNLGAGKRAMVVCRVIAGRSYRASSSSSSGAADIPALPNGYDSVVGGVGSDGGDLVVFNPRAVLPCFVVIYKC